MIKEMVKKYIEEDNFPNDVILKIMEDGDWAFVHIGKKTIMSTNSIVTDKPTLRRLIKELRTKARELQDELREREESSPFPGEFLHISHIYRIKDKP